MTSGKRRLLVVSHGFPPYYGGAEHAAGHLARAAAASGRWQVQVLTSDIGGRLPPNETRDDVEIVRVPARKRDWARHTVRELVSFLNAARRFRPVRPPDLVVANCALPAGAVARRIAKRTGAPYAVVLQGSDVPGYQNARFGPIYLLIKPWLRRIWREAARVVAVGGPLRELALQTWPEGRIEVIPNGVDVELFRPLETVRKEGSRPWIQLVVVAQLIERKGIQHLIAALADLPAIMLSRTSLTLYGTGPYADTLRQQVEKAGLREQVKFAGLLPYEELPKRLREADVFILPTLQEGLPLSLMEAMASGLPVLATAVGGIPDVVHDGVNGLLVPAGDVPALRDALVRLIDDRLLRIRLGEAARREALSWSWTALWERYEALFPASPG